MEERGSSLIVHRNQRALLVAQDALELALGGLPEVAIDLLGGDRPRGLEHEVGQRGVEQRHPHRMTVQLAGQLREDLGDGLGGAGGGGDQGLTAGPGPAQVLVALVDDGLGVGDVVDGGHAAVDDTDALMHHLDHRGQAVGGAGGRGDQMVDGGVIAVIVDPVDDVERTLGRGGDDDLLHPLIEIGLKGLGPLVVFAGRLDDDLAAGPVGLGDLLVAAVADGVTVDGHAVRGAGTVMAPTAMDRVELEQMREPGHRAISLMWVKLRPGEPQPARSPSLPMRPKPLIPILIIILEAPLL